MNESNLQPHGSSLFKRLGQRILRSDSARGLPLFAVLFAVFAPGILFRGEVPYIRDLWNLHRPLRWALLHSTELSGWPPLWNPFSAGGQPLAANPHYGVFHPLTWPFFFLEWETAFALQILIPLAATFLGMIVLLRELNCDFGSSVFGAVAWTFGGLGLSLTDLLPMLWTIAALPAALTFGLKLRRQTLLLATLMDRFDETGVAKGDAWNVRLLVAGFASSLAMVIAGAEPASILIAGFAIVLCLATAIHGMPSRRGIVLTLASAALAIGLSACVWLPGLGLLAKTDRGTPASASERAVWSTPPVRLLDVVNRPLYEWPSDGPSERSWYSNLYPDRQAPLLHSLYPGFLVASLGVAGLLIRFRHHFWELTLIAIGITFALGSHTVVWRTLSTLPGLDVGRYPEKWSVLIILGLVVVSSRTLSRILLGPLPERRRLALTALLTGGNLLLLQATRLSAVGGAESTDPPFVFPALAVGTVLWLLIDHHTSGIRSIAKTALPILILAAELWVAGNHLIPTWQPDSHDEIPDFLVPAANAETGSRLFHLASLRSDPGRQRWLAPPPITTRWRISTLLDDDVDATQLRWTSRFQLTAMDFVSAHPQIAPVLLGRLGVTNISEVEKVEGGDQHLYSAHLKRVTEALPFSYCADAIKFIESEDQWGEVAPAVLSAPGVTSIIVSEEARPGTVISSACQSRVLTWTADLVEIAVHAQGPSDSLLHVNQSWDPGWTATIDGELTPVLRRDLAFCAVEIPPGNHVVRLAYRDSKVVVGALTTAAAALLLCGITLGHRRARSVSRP